MTTLTSPGVSVDIIDETFYDTGVTGTVPLIILATASNKLTPSASGIAPLTTKANACTLYAPTSQRDLLAQYGNPFFWSNQGTPIHGYELNEYGLHAAWQTMGTQNACYTLRADIDLAALAPTRSAPVSAPVNGTYWFDYTNSSFGVYLSNGNASTAQAWTRVVPLITAATDLDSNNVPVSTLGVNGQFAVVPQTTDNLLYQKVSGTWVMVGSTTWKAANVTIVRGVATATPVTGTIAINGTNVSPFTNASLSAVVNAINSTSIANITASIVNGAVEIHNTLGLNVTLSDVSGTALEGLGLFVDTTKGNSLVFTNNASYPTGSVAGDVWIKMTAPANGTAFSLKLYNASTNSFQSKTLVIYPYDSTMLDGNALKDIAATTGFGSSLTNNTVYLAFDPATGSRQFRIWTSISGWSALVYEASVSTPTSAPVDGTLWYSPDYKADIMVSNGQNWRAYRAVYANTDPNGVIISGSAPLAQSDGTALVSGDLWIDSSDLENYPALYLYDETAGRWGSVDNTDQTTPAGVVFADARQDSGPAFVGQTNTTYAHNSALAADLVLSDYLDPDAPDARNYPAGMMLFNTRASTYNIKKWSPNYFKVGGFDPDTDYSMTTYHVGGSAFTFPALSSTGRWVTASGNKLDGSPYMGRKAQRAMVVQAMQAAVENCDSIRSDAANFSLILAPGYPELFDEMSALNDDKSQVASLIVDMPCRLKPADVENWVLNKANAGSNGEDGLVTSYDYAMAYYPWGLSTNVDGSDVMVPSSTMALRTILYNDQVGQVWFAPAGDERGLVNNASSVGYLTSEGEYAPLMLNSIQRGILYSNKINPIVAVGGLGLRVMGQKTLSNTTGALDRVQGARLANYLRVSLAQLTRPFLFAQNDAQTRGTAKMTVERFFNGLITLRAISDYAVLVDETNNTKERQARHELWIDCAVLPLFAIEFIYVPCRFRDDDLSF